MLLELIAAIGLVRFFHVIVGLPTALNALSNGK
jgi:hypothetical protein